MNAPTTRLRHRSLNRLSWTEFELAETGVRVREKTMSGIHEAAVDYDRIGKEAAYFIVYSAKAKLAIIVFSILSVICVVSFALYQTAEAFSGVFWLAFAVFAFFYYQNTKQEGYRLDSDYGAVTLVGKRAEVSAFLDNLVLAKEKFIEANARQRLKIMDRGEAEKYLLALREGRVLSHSQYDALRLKTGLEETQRTNVGFGG